MAGPPANPTLPRLRVDVEGDWYDGDEAITHPGILANLRAGLRRDATGYYLQTRVRIPVEVADVPWVVTRLERRRDALRAWLNDGTVESIDPATLRIGPGEVPYCTVKSGAFQARLSRAAAFQLWALTQADDDAASATLHVAGRDYRVRRTAR